MSLQEIDFNTVAISRFSHFSSFKKRKRNEDSSNNDSETTNWTFNELRFFVCDLRELNHAFYAEIYDKTDVKIDTASKIVRQAKQATTSENSLEIIDCFSQSKSSDRLLKIVDDIKNFVFIRFEILKNNITKWRKMTKKTEFKLSRHTIENIVKEHRNETNFYVIKWEVRSFKSHLNFFDEQIREKYDEWIIIQLNNDAIFIFSNETYIEIKEFSRKKQKIFRFVDVSFEFYAIAQSFVQFCIMLWEACCEDERVERSAHCWVLFETAQQKQNHKEKLRKKNLKRAKYVEWQRNQIIISEIDEYVKFKKVNDRIHQYNVIVIAQNERIKSKYDKNLKRFMISRRLFVYEELTRDEEEDIDWFLYRKYILRFHLYSYYLVIRELNSDRKIYLVEDDAEAHVKVVIVDAQYRKKQSILNASHSVNSSDLHSIEDVWNYEKNSLNEYNLERNDVSENAQTKVKEIVLKKWRENQTKTITNICQRFRKKCEQCIRVDDTNKFKD